MLNLYQRRKTLPPTPWRARGDQDIIQPFGGASIGKVGNHGKKKITYFTVNWLLGREHFYGITKIVY